MHGFSLFSFSPFLYTAGEVYSRTQNSKLKKYFECFSMGNFKFLKSYTTHTRCGPILIVIITFNGNKTSLSFLLVNAVFDIFISFHLLLYMFCTNGLSVKLYQLNVIGVCIHHDSSMLFLRIPLYTHFKIELTNLVYPI